MTACQRVLNLPELLDRILVELPLLDAWLPQRVNRRFYNHIEAPSDISRPLHLTPTKRSKVTTIAFFIFGCPWYCCSIGPHVFRETITYPDIDVFNFSPQLTRRDGKEVWRRDIDFTITRKGGAGGDRLLGKYVAYAAASPEDAVESTSGLRRHSGPGGYCEEECGV